MVVCSFMRATISTLQNITLKKKVDSNKHQILRKKIVKTLISFYSQLQF
jgi:hypothetical protein